MTQPRVSLRPVTLADVSERYVGWLNDEPVAQFLETRFEPQTLDSVKAFVESQLSDPASRLLAIVLNDGNRHIGNIKLGPINRRHRVAEVSLFIGERDCWGRGLASEAISIVSRVAFEEEGLHKVTAGCYAANEGSRRAFLKAGWFQEGIRRAHFWMGAGWDDYVLLARFAPGEEPDQRPIGTDRKK